MTIQQHLLLHELLDRTSMIHYMYETFVKEASTHTELNGLIPITTVNQITDIADGLEELYQQLGNLTP